MSLRINDEAPNFSAETTQGTIDFHQWIGNGWAILFSHPKDFTPVCTTELGYMAGLQPEFAKRNCKIIGLSVDPVSSHGKWAADTRGARGRQAVMNNPGVWILGVTDDYDLEGGIGIVVEYSGQAVRTCGARQPTWHGTTAFLS